MAGGRKATGRANRAEGESRRLLHAGESVLPLVAAAGVRFDNADRAPGLADPCVDLDRCPIGCGARAVECAGAVAGNEGFWKFANALFAGQPADRLRYGALASSTGIDGIPFATCYANASTTVDTRIWADRRNALDIGAQGTPYSLILTDTAPPVVMIGAYSYDAVKRLIDQALGN